MDRVHFLRSPNRSRCHGGGRGLQWEGMWPKPTLPSFSGIVLPLAGGGSDPIHAIHCPDCSDLQRKAGEVWLRSSQSNYSTGQAVCLNWNVVSFYPFCILTKGRGRFQSRKTQYFFLGGGLSLGGKTA
uniref:Uncharacterized protein n=1 Tax=Sphaerodactylus townsendi TaxID=933632 RepID=A0ACB8G5W3_9SAUR